MLNTRQTNNRRSLRWWTCERCGNDYPEDKVLRQKGLILCNGEGTNGCRDEYGYEYYKAQVDVPYERVPENPPEEPWEDI